MSDPTTTSPTVKPNATPPKTIPAVTPAARDTASRLLPWWKDATPQQQQWVLEDMEGAFASDGLPHDVYCEAPVGLAEHMALVLEQRADNGWPIPTTTADVHAAQLAATLDATADATARRQQAADTLAKCVQAWRTGETAMRAGRLEAGRLASVYVAERLALGDKRQAALSAIEGELSKHASEAVDATVLIRAYMAYALLNGDAEPETTLSYGHYSRVLTQLVTRTNPDTDKERWALLPGFESRALVLFRNAATNALSQAAVKDSVTGLHKEYATALAEQRDAEAKAAAEQASKAAAQHTAAVEKQKAAEAADKAAKDALDKAAADKRAELTAAAEKAKADKLAAQRQATELSHARRQAEQTAAAAEKSRQAAEKARDKTSGPKPKAEENKPTPRPAPVEPSKDTEPRVPNPVASAKQATPKDLACLLRDMVCANKPADVLREFASCFDWRAADATALAAGIASNPGRHALEFANALATALIDLLPTTETTSAAA